MSEVKFKAGDLVYIFGSNKIGKITGFLSVNAIKVHNQKEHFHSARLCHATQENYEMLTKAFPNIQFELPPKPKAPKEVIREMLESGWAYVPCWVNDFKGDFRNTDLITNINDGSGHTFRGFFSWWCAIPFDPKTGKTIIDYVNGEVVLED